jgi:phosphatidylserine/phosphatidylglycerophosphate/cardiolipin synthase-like enzyme
LLPVTRPKRLWLAFPLALALTLFAIQAQASTSTANLDVVINEIAWMGTTTSSSDEWIELYNNTAGPIDLTDWTLITADGSIAIVLSGAVPAGGYLLLERTNDDSVPGVPADLIYSGGLGNDGEDLVLRDGSSVVIDRVDCSAGWFSGHEAGRVPMARVSTTLSGSLASNWTYNPRCGSATNSDGISHTCEPTVTTVDHGLDYAAYFSDLATTGTAVPTTRTPMEDALLYLIDGATTSIDVALYGLDRQSVVDALIAAHNRGVAVRVVGDDDAATGDYNASYQALTDAGITIVTDASADIEHNKFAIIDGQIVWTGSTNLTDTGFTLNANNSVVITDTALAGAYTTEFEEMWAGTFHADKTDNTPHLFDYDGTLVESYFSPSDLVAFEVWDELANADATIHFAMFFWTDDVLTQRVKERIGAGVEVYGVWDELGAASPTSADEELAGAGAQIRIEDFPGKVHHKFAVIDVQGSDPTVILGSYNWTDSGAYANDENTLIVHDSDLAQAYYAEWLRLWSALDGPGMSHWVYLPLTVRSGESAADLQITFIEYDPPGSDVEGEYVRIENLGGSAADMTNWTLRDEADHVFTFPTFTLSPGATVQVWTKSGANTATDLYWGSGSAIWNNTGDCAYLRDSGGTAVDTYCY